MKFNDKLITLRKQSGLSQDELGALLHVSRQTVSKWELGQSYPDFHRLVALSDEFDITLDELVKNIDVADIQKDNKTNIYINEMHGDYVIGKAKVQDIINIVHKSFRVIGLITVIIVLMVIIYYLYLFLV